MSVQSIHLSIRGIEFGAFNVGSWHLGRTGMGANFCWNGNAHTSDVIESRVYMNTRIELVLGAVLDTLGALTAQFLCVPT